MWMSVSHSYSYYLPDAVFSYFVLTCVLLLRIACMGVILILWLVSLSLPFIKEGKVVVGIGEGSKCLVILFLRLRGMSSRLLCRMDPVRDVEWELLVGWCHEDYEHFYILPLEGGGCWSFPWFGNLQLPHFIAVVGKANTCMTSQKVV